MSAAYDYEDMHHLVDRLTPAQVQRLRLLVTQDEELSQVSEDSARVVDEPPAGLLALIGAVDGPPDLAERHDDHIRDRLRRRFDDPA